MIITYRTATDPKDVRAKINGDVIAMEMVPEDFRIEAELTLNRRAGFLPRLPPAGHRPDVGVAHVLQNVGS